jgi:hypothetical protein
VTSADSKSAKSKAEKRPAEEKQRTPIGLLAAAWLIPGLGHWIVGKRTRAVVFAVVICCAFATGVLLDGEIGTPNPQSPFSWLAAFACLGNGLLSIARLTWLNGVGGLLANFPFALQGGGSPSAAGFAYGNTFLYTAGLMNLLVVLDVSDIFRGDKN